MLYDKSKKEQLTREDFFAPGAEYRGFPFWAWNGVVDDGEVVEQVEIFKEMGFGGFYMHVRQGLETEYMGDGFLGAVSDCVERARELSLYACLYDEDRWPSGPAGGIVTKDIRYRVRFLEVCPMPKQEYTLDMSKAYEDGIPLFVGSFRLTPSAEGTLLSYEKVADGEVGELIRHFYISTDMKAHPRYNFQTNADLMSPEAVNRFIEVTHEKYFERVGAEFGKTVPTIFFDEPQPIAFSSPESPYAKKCGIAPWTLKLAERYREIYGEDIYARVPEIFYTMADGSGKSTRYRYMRVVSEMFYSSFSDTISDWCAAHGILATGHMVTEQHLEWASERAGGDIMRGYRKMQLPGIDLLSDGLEITTAKQCQSAVNQYGREGMMSELYGVAGWDFDFASHKFQGDWQACMGVTMRVPHLCWQTMKGEGKRDYPTSIFYQAPWYKEYKFIEDHFARVNTALTRGRPEVRVALLHPIETYWMYLSDKSETSRARDMNERFEALPKMLTDLGFDFNYISESLLPDLASGGSTPLRIGKMEYDVLLLADCETLRPHTLKVLEEFANFGGKIITVGATPHLCDAAPSARACALSERATHIDYTPFELSKALAPYRDIDLRSRGQRLPGYCYALRKDGNGKWLFIARTEKMELRRLHKSTDLEITVRGKFIPTLYDTVSGDITKISYRHEAEATVISHTLWSTDSLLLRLDEARDGEADHLLLPQRQEEPILLREEWGRLAYRTEEPNVLLLDMAEYALDGEALRPTEELMVVDRKIRERLGFTQRQMKFAQPWYLRDLPEDHTVVLRFTVSSDIFYPAPILALEDAKKMKITFNGEAVSNTPTGYYVDRHIDTVTLPPLRKGENVLTVEMPFGMRTDIENLYLLGDFGVRVCGRYTSICERATSLAFGDIVAQGHPFYSGNVVYESELTLDTDGDLTVEMTYIRGAAAEVWLDGEKRMIALSPNRALFKNIKRGKHKLEYRLLGNRHNTFSALHNLEQDFPTRLPYCGPGFWRSRGQGFAYEYQLHPFGIMKAPILYLSKSCED